MTSVTSNFKSTLHICLFKPEDESQGAGEARFLGDGYGAKGPSSVLSEMLTKIYTTFKMIHRHLFQEGFSGYCLGNVPLSSSSLFLLTAFPITWVMRRKQVFVSPDVGCRLPRSGTLAQKRVGARWVWTLRGERAEGREAGGRRRREGSRGGKLVDTSEM